MRASATLCLSAAAFALAACPGPATDKDNGAALAPEANKAAEINDVIQTGNVSTPVAGGVNKCCTGPTLSDSCVAMPANGACPGDKPVIVSEP